MQTAKIKQSKPPYTSRWDMLEDEQIESSGILQVEGENLNVSNVGRHVWKGFTKAELIQYYHNVSKYILPHLKDRPLSLFIKPYNAYSEGFFIKDMEGREPEWAQTFPIERKHKEKGKRDIINYLLCQNEATLLYCINLGCIDFNPWSSRIQSPDMPDYIVIDL